MTAPTARPSRYARIASACHDHRRVVVVAWVAAIVLVGVLAGAFGNSFRDKFDLPDSDSRTGVDILQRDFGGIGTGATGTIVFRADQGVDDPAVQQAMTEVFAAVAEQPNVLGVDSPYGPDGAIDLGPGTRRGLDRLRQRQHAR